MADSKYNMVGLRLYGIFTKYIDAVNQVAMPSTTDVVEHMLDALFKRPPMRYEDILAHPVFMGTGITMKSSDYGHVILRVPICLRNNLILHMYIKRINVLYTSRILKLSRVDVEYYYSTSDIIKAVLSTLAPMLVAGIAVYLFTG